MRRRLRLYTYIVLVFVLGGLLDLEVRWRKHFLSTMKPKHLPPLWSINHQVHFNKTFINSIKKVVIDCDCYLTKVYFVSLLYVDDHHLLEFSSLG